MVAHVIQHPGTVSACVMARVLGISEERMKQAARLGWVPCKWTRGRRAKFDPKDVVDHLEECPRLIDRIRPRIRGADILDAALWALDAITLGLQSASPLPSSIALALYFWARRAKANQDMLSRFLLSFGFTRYQCFGPPDAKAGAGESIPDDFRAMMEQLEREGLAFRRRVARRARRSIRRATAEFERDRALGHFTLVSADAMSHILGAPIDQLEEMAAGGKPLYLTVGSSRRYCVEEVIAYVLEHELPFPPKAGYGTPDEAWQWAAEAHFRIQGQPTAPSRLAWEIWLWARCSRVGERQLLWYDLRRASGGASSRHRQPPALRSLRAV